MSDPPREADPLIQPLQEALLSTEPASDQPLAMNREAAAKGFAWSAGFSFVAKVVFPLAGLYISRTLGPVILGIASLLQMTLQLSEVIRDAGLTQTFLAEPEIDRLKESTYTGLALLTGVVPALGVLILTPFLASFFRQPELIWALPFIALCLVLNSIGTVPNAMLLRKAQFRRQGMIGLAAGGVTLAVTIVLVFLGFGFRALVVQFVLGCTLGLLFTLRLEPLTGIRFDRHEIRATFRRTRALLGANLINNVFLLCDIFVIQKLVGPKAAGLYNSAQNIAYKPADLILFPLSKTLMVAFSQSGSDRSKLSRAYYRSLSAIVLLVLPIYAFIGLNADGIMKLLLGPKFVGGIPVLQVLSIYLACRTLGNISGNALVPAGKHHWTLWPWFLAILVTGAGLAVCAGHPSLMAIVWSFTAGAIAVYVLTFMLAVRLIRPEPEHLSRLLRSVLPTFGTSLVLLLIAVSPLGSIPRLFAGVLLSPLVQLGLIGTVFEGNALAYMSRRGLSNLWRSL